MSTYSLPSNICQIQASLLATPLATPPPIDSRTVRQKTRWRKGWRSQSHPFWAVFAPFRTIFAPFCAVSDRSESFSDRFERRTLRKVRENLRKLRENFAKIRESLVLWKITKEADNIKPPQLRTGQPTSRLASWTAEPTAGQIIQTADGAKKFSKTCFLKPNGAENFFK